MKVPCPFRHCLKLSKDFYARTLTERNGGSVKNIVLRILILSVKRSSHGQLRKKEHFKSQALSTYFLVMSEVV